MKDSLIEKRRARAYEIWEQEGKPEGKEAEHWAQASREISDDGSEGPDAASFDAAPAQTSPAVQSLKKTRKTKTGSRDELQEGLEDSFPASDPVAATNTSVAGGTSNE